MPTFPDFQHAYDIHACDVPRDVKTGDQKPPTAANRKRQPLQSRHCPVQSNPSTADRYSCHAAGFRTITRERRRQDTHSTTGSKRPLLDDRPICPIPGERVMTIVNMDIPPNTPRSFVSEGD